MASESRSGASHWHWHFAVPVVGASLALLLWVWWLSSGMSLAHRQVLDRIQAASAASSQTNVSSAADVAALQTQRERAFAELGQSGDAFGGLNALLTGIAGVLVLWAGVMQHLTLKQVRAQAAEERRASAKQEAVSAESLRLAQQALEHQREDSESERQARRLQEFEALFFRLLELSSAVTNRIETDRPPSGSVTIPGEGTRFSSTPVRTGPAALASFASSLRTSALAALPRHSGDPHAQLTKLVGLFLTQVYDRRPSAFGPYYRLLYQTFRHVSDSHLTYESQVKYANIARGQISEGAVLLLALNGLTVDGYKFLPLIEKFGLLEHMHRRYKSDFKNLLLLGYRDRAFLGSSDREVPGNEFIDIPKLDSHHFAALESNRKLAEEESAFGAGFTGVDDEDF